MDRLEYVVGRLENVEGRSEDLVVLLDDVVVLLDDVVLHAANVLFRIEKGALRLKHDLCLLEAVVFPLEDVPCRKEVDERDGKKVVA